MEGLTVTLTTAPTLLAGSGSHGNIRVTVRNRGAGNVYLGGAAVTTAAGYQLSTGDTAHTVTIGPGESLYGTSTGSIVVDVLRVGDTTST
jgi:hypothetical protein